MNLLHRLLLACWLCGACCPAPASASAEVLITARQRSALGISVVTATAVERAPLAALPAMVRAPGNSTHPVVVPLTGTVTRLLAQDGMRVKRGQPLLQLRSQVYSEQRALGVSARSAANVAEAQAVRDRKLAEEGIISQRRLQESEASLRVARANVAHQEETLRAVRAAPDTPGEYQLLSPAAGVLSETGLALGQPVESGRVAFEIHNGGDVWLEAQLPERLMEQVEVGYGVTAGPSASAGRVLAVGRTLSPETRAALLRAVVPNGPGLRPGQSAELVVYAPVPVGTVVLPGTALVKLRGQDVVFAATAKGFTPIVVKAGTTTAAGVAVQANGLVGRSVAVSGVASLKSLALATDEGK